MLILIGSTRDVNSILEADVLPLVLSGQIIIQEAMFYFSAILLYFSKIKTICTTAQPMTAKVAHTGCSLIV